MACFLDLLFRMDATTHNRRRSDKPTVEIPRRTIAECAARWALHQAQTAAGETPTVDLER